ncbi:Serine/threonine-protein kinase pksC [Minicystis rosea]|nr:Serine/threonine-protein kinase pksC [Minicystis rosea]
MRPQVGQVINNKYRLLRLVGDGGMGSVYEARHEVLGTSVALKFLHLELSRRPGLIQRFLQEARVSAQVQSPHVVRVTDVDQTAGGAFIVMEFVEGRTLQTLYEDLYRAGQQLSYVDALEYAMQMLEGVEAAHKQGIVHRDLKPDNVMITQGSKGRQLIKLLDFGIAKLKVEGAEADRGLTRPGVIMGTPEYMAPEQAFSADAVDARADIFSLGVIIFEMLAGRRPVGGDEPQQIAAAYLSGRIAYLTDLAPSIAPELAAVVHHAMGAMTKDRFQTVTAFRDALEPFAAAAKAPSALPMGALSNPNLSNPNLSNPNIVVRPSVTPEPAAVTPPATNVGEAMARSSAAALPQTLAPASAAASAAAREASSPRLGGLDGDTTNPAGPPAMSNPRGPTPIGGFAALDASAAAGHVPVTKSVSPYASGAVAIDPAATAFASPLAAPFEAKDMAPLELSPRPSGTAIGDFDMPAGGAPIEIYGGPAPLAYTPQPAMVGASSPKTKPKRGMLSSLPAILVLAAGVAAAVVGGVYVAHSRAKTDDHEDPVAAPPPATTVRSDPPAEAPTALPTQAPASKGPPPQQIPRKPYVPPKGSTSPNQPPPPGTAPTSRPGLLPPGIPPFVIPSSLPFGFPFEPPPRTIDPPRSQPDLPRDDPRRAPREPQYRPQAREEPDPWGDRQRSRPRSRPGALPYGPQSHPNDGPDDY